MQPAAAAAAARGNAAHAVLPSLASSCAALCLNLLSSWIGARRSRWASLASKAAPSLLPPLL